MRDPSTIRGIGRVCQTCDFWKPGMTVDEFGEFGQCQCEPPRATLANRVGQFPLTRKDDWCGQWEPEERSEIVTQIINARANLQRWEQQLASIKGAEDAKQ